jgi:hypothetical protein
MNFRINGAFALSSTILSSLVGLAAIAAPAGAATNSLTNPCPQIYYEEPYNSSKVLPATCPANAATRSRNGQSELSVVVPTSAPVSTSQPLLSPVEPAPIGTVKLQSGRVNVKLKNMTNTQITYQVIGDTAQRALAGKTESVLQDLSAPVTITFLRPDAGLVSVTLSASAESDTLVLMLDEAMSLSDSQTSVRIQTNGNVLAY